MTEETDRNSIEGGERARIISKQEGSCKSQAKTMRIKENARNILKSQKNHRRRIERKNPPKMKGKHKLKKSAQNNSN